MPKMSRGQTICLDFDGVLHSYTSGWNGPVPTDPPTEGAQAFVFALRDHGYDVVIQTTRANTAQGLMATVEWLKVHGFPDNLDVTHEKVPALLYVDDRGYRFEGDFGAVLKFALGNKQPWNSRHKEGV